MNSRRSFLKQSVLASAGLTTFLKTDAWAETLKVPRRVSPSDRLNIGLIGCKGMGWNNLNSFLKLPDVACAGLCDVDENVLNQRREELGKRSISPKIYGDYRRMLDDRDIDAVIVATPDHWHCLIMTDACSAGKDIYCEKPLSNSIAEAGWMVAAARRHNRVVQVNQWQRSQQHFKDAVAFVQSGKLGPILTTKTWMYRGNSQPLPVRPDAPVPAGVNYDMWLGPAPKRPFNPNRFHYEFRWFWDYAGGLMTDWGVHLIDIVLWAMKAEAPQSVMAMGGKIAFPDDARQTPDVLQALYDYGTFQMSWENVMGPANGLYNRQHGIAFVGKNGTLVVNRGGWEVLPEKDLMEPVALQKQADNGLDLHTANFRDVVKSRNTEALNCPVEAGARVALNAHMGNIAYRMGQKIRWNGKQFDHREAQQLVSPQYHNNYRTPRA